MNIPAVAEVGTPAADHELFQRDLRPVLVSGVVFEMLADRVEWGEPDEKGWFRPVLSHVESECKPTCAYHVGHVPKAP